MVLDSPAQASSLRPQARTLSRKVRAALGYVMLLSMETAGAAPSIPRPRTN